MGAKRAGCRRRDDFKKRALPDRSVVRLHSTRAVSWIALGPCLLKTHVAWLMPGMALRIPVMALRIPVMASERVFSATRSVALTQFCQDASLVGHKEALATVDFSPEQMTLLQLPSLAPAPEAARMPEPPVLGREAFGFLMASSSHGIQLLHVAVIGLLFHCADLALGIR